MEAQEDGWLVEYERLWAEGKGHGEALRRIQAESREPKPDISMLLFGIQQSKARRKVRLLVAREAEIRRLAAEGLTRPEIADRLRLAYHTVMNAAERAGIAVPVRQTIRSKAPAAWCGRPGA